MSKEELLYSARITEQTERFEEMLTCMKEYVSHKGEDLSVEERNLLSVAYKNSVGSRRTAWRALSQIEQKETAKGSKNLHLLEEFKKKIEDELRKYCDDILNLLDDNLIPKASSEESKVFFLKMKGDYYRYIAEFVKTDELKNISEAAHKSYKQADEVAKKLKTTHPIRLGLSLNYSVFYYEVLDDAKEACNLAKNAFDDAIADIEQIDEEQYKDATTIM